MSTIVGLGFSDVRPQPGFTATQGENGGWAGRHKFEIRRTAWDQAGVRSKFQKGTAITTLDTGLSSFFDFLGVVEVTVLSEEGDLMMVETSLAGAGGAQYGEEGLSGTAEPTYRLDGQLQEAPLDQHPKWAALDDEQKAALGHLINGVLVYDDESGKICTINGDATTSDEFFDPFLPYDDIVTGDCLEFAKIIASGNTTYLKALFTWTERAQGTGGLTGAQINKLGRISTPRGDPPTPNGSRDWMLTGASQDSTGQSTDTFLEWTLSERGGHNSFLYDD